VISPGNLPTFEDRSSLPYISAIAKESVRWREHSAIGYKPLTSIRPLLSPDVVSALPHFSTAEDEYKGYRIPKGAVVLYNAW